jgi:hypothetical protein
MISKSAKLFVSPQLVNDSCSLAPAHSSDGALALALAEASR